MSSVATAEAYAAPEAEITFDSEQEAPKLFSIRGRMGVLKYAAQSFMWTVAYVVLSAVIVAGSAALSSSGSSLEGANPVLLGILGLALLPLLFIMLSMAIKRLHDINMSGWFLLAALVPIVNLFFFLFMTLKPGKAETNKFGAQTVTKGWEKVVGGIYIALIVIALVSIVLGFASGGVAALMQ